MYIIYTTGRGSCRQQGYEIKTPDFSNPDPLPICLLLGKEGFVFKGLDHTKRDNVKVPNPPSQDQEDPTRYDRSNPILRRTTVLHIKNQKVDDMGGWKVRRVLE